MSIKEIFLKYYLQNGNLFIKNGYSLLSLGGRENIPVVLGLKIWGDVI
jgi:hypothetical protein